MRWGVLLAVVLVAGCSTKPMDDGSEDPSRGGTPPATSLAPGQALAAPAPTAMILNGCNGLRTEWSWVANGPGQAPEGWGTEWPVSSVGLQLLNCTRMSWGDFERPMTLLLEYHTKFQAPEGCASDQRMHILNAVWVSDPDFAGFLRQVHSLPAQHAEFVEHAPSGDVPATLTWSWRIAGGEPSELAIHVLGDAQYANVWPDRFFWDNGKGISYVDFNATWDSIQEMGSLSHPYHLVLGTLRPPMLMAEAGMEDYVSYYGHREVDLDASGALMAFGDYECKRHAPL